MCFECRVERGIDEMWEVAPDVVEFLPESNTENKQPKNEGIPEEKQVVVAQTPGNDNVITFKEEEEEEEESGSKDTFCVVESVEEVSPRLNSCLNKVRFD